jgi:hypothetical protein
MDEERFNLIARAELESGKNGGLLVGGPFDSLVTSTRSFFEEMSRSIPDALSDASFRLKDAITIAFSEPTSLEKAHQKVAESRLKYSARKLAADESVAYPVNRIPGVGAGHLEQDVGATLLTDVGFVASPGLAIELIPARYLSATGKFMNAVGNRLVGEENMTYRPTAI